MKFDIRVFFIGTAETLCMEFFNICWNVKLAFSVLSCFIRYPVWGVTLWETGT